MSDENNKISDKLNERITRKGMVVWCALIFFVMSWMFVLGILVGRGTAPIPVRAHSLEKELDELKTAMLDNAEADMKTGSKKELQASDLGFHEALRKAPAKEIYKVVSPSSPRKKPEPAVVAPAKAPVPVAVQPPAAVKPEPAAKEDKLTVQPLPAPTAKPEQRSAAPAAPSAAQSGRYTIQIAAFKDTQSAERMVGELRNKGYPGYSLHSEIPGKGTWYRVRVGGFEDRAAAEGMLKRLNGDRFQGIVIGTQ